MTVQSNGPEQIFIVHYKSNIDSIVYEQNLDKVIYITFSHSFQPSTLHKPNKLSFECLSFKLLLCKRWGTVTYWQTCASYL